MDLLCWLVHVRGDWSISTPPELELGMTIATEVRLEASLDYIAVMVNTVNLTESRITQETHLWEHLL